MQLSRMALQVPRTIDAQDNRTVSTPWKAGLRRPARYLIGVTVCSAGVALAIDSGLGAAPYDSLLTGLAGAFAMPYWLAAWVMTALWIVAVKLLGGSIGARQIVHGALFGPVIEVLLKLLPEAGDLPVQLLYAGGGIISIAVGIHLFLSAQVLSGVLDTLFETVATRFRVGPNAVRGGFDILSVGAAIALGGKIGPLTLAVAMTVAPVIAVLHRFGQAHAMVRTWRGIRLSD